MTDPTPTSSGPALPGEGFDDWGRYFTEFAPVYEDVAFGGAGVAWVGGREEDTVLAALGAGRPGAVLDAGTGTGRLARRLLERGWDVTGMDVSPGMLACVGAQLPALTPVLGRLGEPLPLADAAFDAVVCIRVLKYVARPDVALAELARVLRPGGLLVLEWTNRRSASRFGYGTTPIHLLTRREVEALVHGHGFDVEAMHAGTRLPQPAWRAAATPARARLAAGAERALGTALGGRRSTFGARSSILVGRRR